MVRPYCSPQSPHRPPPFPPDTAVLSTQHGHRRQAPSPVGFREELALFQGPVHEADGGGRLL
eukprot:scaffold211648_cov24-Tisochrysis_lutea.AAC.1